MFAVLQSGDDVLERRGRKAGAFEPKMCRGLGFCLRYRRVGKNVVQKAEVHYGCRMGSGRCC